MSDQSKRIRNILGEFNDDNHPVEGLVLNAVHRLTALQADHEKLKTIMMAAAVEITEHWESHCDSEGYGPSNLVTRLERGLHGGGYAYTAEDWIKCQEKIERLEGELGRLIRDMRAIDGCFEAALCEGWNEVVADGDVDRITDIYHRRIEYARHTAVNAISLHENSCRECGGQLDHGYGEHMKEHSVCLSCGKQHPTQEPTNGA